jgi:alkanesulfonate monooxygenase SsuD/methylene tetrahydromethanopterin reductase-like flavin-dependent oxidoreductase (luciferase family)
MHLPVMVPGLDRDKILDWSHRIDRGPFATLAAGERITFPNPEIGVTLSAAAAVTSRVSIAFSVLVLPMHSPVLVAKQVATLDVLSGGRVSLGVGVGGREEDYRAVGAAFDDRFGKLERGVDLLRRAWTGESVVPGALRPVEPLPVQQGGPEILAGALFPRSVRRAARWADGLTDFSFGPSADEVGNRFDLARNAWKEEGRDAPPRLVGGFWFAIGPGARERMDAYLARYLNFMGPGVAEKLAPTVTTTSDAALRDAVQMMADLGADEVLLTPVHDDPEDVDRVADILA